jgi:WD40 repeat protein
LPFAPQNPKIRAVFSQKFPHLAQVDSVADHWPRLKNDIAADSPISFIAYARDGRHIALGSFDSTIHVRDAETGEAVGEPLRGHSAAVCSVAYSPNCHRIVSGSFDPTLRVWNARTGEPIGKPFRSYANAVLSVSYSPNGHRIVSGSLGGTVRVWDAGTGAAICEAISGYLNVINSVAYFLTAATLSPV